MVYFLRDNVFVLFEFSLWLNPGFPSLAELPHHFISYNQRFAFGLLIIDWSTQLKILTVFLFYSIFLSESPIPPSLLPPICSTTNTILPSNTIPRRTRGYVAMERLAFDKNIELCFVEEGEVLCDVENLLGIDTNIFTVNAAMGCDVYTLSRKNYDKIVIKKNPQTLNLVKMIAETKLLARKDTIPGKKLDILPILLYRLRFVKAVNVDMETEEREKASRKRPALTIDDLPEYMPSRALQHKLELELYKRDRAPLVTPITEGAVYFKEMMHRRAKDRETSKKLFPNDSITCKNISRRVKDAIVASVKEGIRTDKMLRKVQLRYSTERASSRWK